MTELQPWLTLLNSFAIGVLTVFLGYQTYERGRVEKRANVRPEVRVLYEEYPTKADVPWRLEVTNIGGVDVENLTVGFTTLLYDLHEHRFTGIAVGAEPTRLGDLKRNAQVSVSPEVGKGFDLVCRVVIEGETAEEYGRTASTFPPRRAALIRFEIVYHRPFDHARFVDETIFVYVCGIDEVQVIRPDELGNFEMKKPVGPPVVETTKAFVWRKQDLKAMSDGLQHQMDRGQEYRRLKSVGRAVEAP